MPVGEGTGPSLTTRALGFVFGSETHQLSVDELANHSHGYVNTARLSPGQQGASFTEPNHGEVIGTSSTGGSLPHNNMQPGLVISYIIKY